MYFTSINVDYNVGTGCAVERCIMLIAYIASGKGHKIKKKQRWFVASGNICSKNLFGGLPMISYVCAICADNSHKNWHAK